MEKVPRVSIIVPTYNRAHLLERAITSLLSQTNGDFEIIVVDDGSTDNTNQVVNGLKDKRIKYIRHPKNKGVSGSTNTGIVNARGEFIGILCDDDAWLPDKLEKQLKVFDQSNADFGLVYCGDIICDSNKNTTRILPKNRGNIYNLQLQYDHINPPRTWLVRRACFLNPEVGLFDENLLAREDYDMGIRISKAYLVDYVHECLVEAYVDSSNRLSDDYKKVLEGDLQILRKIENQISNYPRAKRKRIVSCHYYYIALHLFTFLRPNEGKGYLKKSFIKWPFNRQSIILLVFILLGDKNLKYFKSCHSLVKNMQFWLFRTFAHPKKIVGL